MGFNSSAVVASVLGSLLVVGIVLVVTNSNDVNAPAEAQRIASTNLDENSDYCKDPDVSWFNKLWAGCDGSIGKTSPTRSGWVEKCGTDGNYLPKYGGQTPDGFDKLCDGDKLYTSSCQYPKNCAYQGTPRVPVTVFWDEATNCELKNGEWPLLSGEVQISTTLSTGDASKQTTMVVNVTGADRVATKWTDGPQWEWNKNLHFKVDNFKDVAPQLNFSLKEGANKDHPFASWNLLDLKLLRAGGYGCHVPPSFGPTKLTIKSMSSRLAQKPDMGICVEFGDLCRSGERCPGYSLQCSSGELCSPSWGECLHPDDHGVCPV